MIQLETMGSFVNRIIRIIELVKCETEQNAAGTNFLMADFAYSYAEIARYEYVRERNRPLKN